MGIDVGTYSTKGVLVAPAGEVLNQHVVPHTGWAEQDADAVWWADVALVCRALLGGPHTGADIVGVAVSAIGPCLLPLDASDRPLRLGRGHPGARAQPRFSRTLRRAL